MANPYLVLTQQKHRNNLVYTSNLYLLITAIYAQYLTCLSHFVNCQRVSLQDLRPDALETPTTPYLHQRQ